MTRLLYTLLLILCLSGCNNDLIDVQTSVPEGEPVDLRLSFGAKGSVQAVISRQTMPYLSDESKVWNLYVFVFDSEGKKIYGRFFDAQNSEADDTKLAPNSWYVSNPSKDSDVCTGTVNIRTISKPGCSIYAIANVNSAEINVSPEALDLIYNEEELQNRVVSLNQQLVERSGFFLMTGALKKVNTGTVISESLKLTRLDAKVRFWVKTGKNSGIEKFELKNWQVVNVPTSSYLLSRDNRKNSADVDSTYFTSKVKNPEDEEVLADGSERYGFSFYMLENGMAPKKTPASYSDRERQEKDAAGLNGAWEYANDNSTYVVISGRVVMKTDALTGHEGATLNANVRYVIHLGDFSENKWDNFATERNTSYTYNVTINGVNDIRVEVETSNDDEEGITENAPGATGEVTIALQEIFDCDAHYTTCTLNFDAKYIKADDVTWYVRTPFSEGSPYQDQNQGVDVTAGLDYEWIEFRVNNKNEDGTYSNKRQRYIPHHTKTDKNGASYASSDRKTMYVDELVAYLKKQKAAYDVNPEDSDFDKNGKLTVTAFVNEFYYEEHPITGEKSSTLWKEFVNRDDMRLMHILSDTKESLDKESTVVGSSFTIQQRSIQTVYNHKHPDLMTAWGVEHFDEYPDLEYNSVGMGTSESRGNTSDLNGHLNTMSELGLASGNTFIQGKRWDEFLDMESADNNVLLDKYKYLRYTCLARNRDNNGDGIIDADELRWYMPAIKQLIGLWIGADGMQNSARMYTRTAEQKANNDPKVWRQHIVSSTANANNSNNPVVVWAEEGCSTGPLGGSIQWGGISKWETKCVRNLGMDDETDLTKVPTDYVKMGGTDKKPIFDLTYLNEKCIRYRVQDGVDLIYSDENSIQNKLYWKFEATAEDCPRFDYIYFPKMQEEVTNSLGNNRFCPKGYRLPNQRELILMAYYCKDSFWSGTSYSFSRTYYSFGAHGSNAKEMEKYGWVRDPGYKNIFMVKNESATHIRAVRDLAL